MEEFIGIASVTAGNPTGSSMAKDLSFIMTLRDIFTWKRRKQQSLFLCFAHKRLQKSQASQRNPGLLLEAVNQTAITLVLWHGCLLRIPPTKPRVPYLVFQLFHPTSHCRNKNNKTVKCICCNPASLHRFTPKAARWHWKTDKSFEERPAMTDQGHFIFGDTWQFRLEKFHSFEPKTLFASLKWFASLWFHSCPWDWTIPPCFFRLELI